MKFDRNKVRLGSLVPSLAALACFLGLTAAITSFEFYRIAHTHYISALGFITILTPYGAAVAEYIVLFSAAVAALLLGCSFFIFYGYFAKAQIANGGLAKKARQFGVTMACCTIAAIFLASAFIIPAANATISSAPTAIVSAYSCEKGPSFLITADNAGTPNYYAIATSGTASTPCGTLVYGGPANAGGASGTTFSTVIQDAINTLTLGGTITVTLGSYTVTTTITQTQSINLIGESYQIGAQANTCASCGTIFLGAQTAGTPILKPTGFSGTIQYITLNGLKQGNSVVAGQDCIQIDNSASIYYIDRVSVYNCPDAGIYDNAPAGEDIIQDADVKTSNLAGYYCNSCFDEHILGGDYGSNVGPGIKGVTCSDITLVGVHEYLSTTDNGIVFSNCTNIVISASTAHNNWKNGIEFFKSVSSAVDGNFQIVTGTTISDNSLAGAGSFAGIQIAGSAGDIASFNTVSNCIFYDDQGAKTQTYGIEETPFANQNTITGNSIGPQQTKAIYSTATNSIISDNAGWNPVGKITNFLIGGTSAVTTHTIGPWAGNSTTEIASQTYFVSAAEFITSANSANANNAIVIKDASGNTMLGPVATLTAQYVPAGYTITWGAFTGAAGAVTVFGA